MKLGSFSKVIALLAAATTFELIDITKPAAAVSLFGLTNDNNLVLFDSATPGATSNISVTGVTGNLLGIDFRPANGTLYGLTSTNNIYTINSSNGAATFVSTLSAPFTGGIFSGVDFNPVPDRLRVVGINEQNLRINVDNGATLVDGTLAYAAGDANAGANPNITAAAYTNSFLGAPSPSRTTQLFGIDSVLDTLVLQNPPNAGTLNTIGSLGIDFSPTGGFDILSANGTNTAFAAANSMLYSIDLSSGAATSLGTIGDSRAFVGLAAAPVPEPDTYVGLGLLGFGALALKLRRRSSKSPN